MTGTDTSPAIPLPDSIGEGWWSFRIAVSAARGGLMIYAEHPNGTPMFWDALTRKWEELDFLKELKP